MKSAIKKIGVLVPYSGTFPDLKQAITQPFKAHSRENGYELMVEYINQGDPKTVENAINKLCYQEDADIITGYLASHIADKMAAQFLRYSSCVFMPFTMGEVIHIASNSYPPNYKPVSYHAWQLQVLLGSMVGSYLQPQSGMICTSLYDCGYSLNECFRIGLQSMHPIQITSSILKNNGGAFDASPLINEIISLKPAHIYVLLCGKPLKNFLEAFDKQVDYQPTLSFAFPVDSDGISLSHPSYQCCYTVYNNMLQRQPDSILTDVYPNIFNAITQKTIRSMDGGPELQDNATILQMDLLVKTTIIADFKFRYTDVTAALLEAADAIPAWQNPYLCI